nr:PREDICTED: olfactory receptor 6N1-like [Latimeria chalumnae]|eukprot:XP_006013164.2 PREDICTED: olfactory receptor 6N1-like [Latimeria chalumnae]
MGAMEKQKRHATIVEALSSGGPPEEEEVSNVTIGKPSGFYLVGFTYLKNSEYFLIFLFLAYVITLLGNFTLMAVVYLCPPLHTPRYMAVFNLAVVDALHSSTTIPKTLQAFLFHSNYIGYNACFIQAFFGHYFTAMESLSLVIMAYDRFIAICFPLRYPSINTNTKMFVIIVSCWLGLIFPLLYMILLNTRLSFCKSIELPSFICSNGPIFRLACGDTSLNLRVTQIVSISLSYGPLTLIFLTYVVIFIAVIKLDSAESRRKPISTCVTHLILVLIFYAPLMVNYMLAQLSLSYSYDVRNITIALASTLPALFNPIIYSFSTEEVRFFIFRAFKKWTIFTR